MGGAVDYLLARDEVTGDKVGVIGFCMGGMLTLILAAQQGDKIGAAVPVLRRAACGNAPDWSGLTAPVSGHFAENDDFFGPEPIKALDDELKAMGKDVDVRRPSRAPATRSSTKTTTLGTYDKDVAEACLAESVAFLKSHLSS